MLRAIILGPQKIDGLSSLCMILFPESVGFMATLNWTEYSRNVAYLAMLVKRSIFYNMPLFLAEGTISHILTLDPFHRITLRNLNALVELP